MTATALAALRGRSESDADGRLHITDPPLAVSVMSGLGGRCLDDGRGIGGGCGVRAEVGSPNSAISAATSAWYDNCTPPGTSRSRPVTVTASPPYEMPRRRNDWSVPVTAGLAVFGRNLGGLPVHGR